MNRFYKKRKRKNKVRFISVLTSVKLTTPFRKEITNYTVLYVTCLITEEDFVFYRDAYKADAFELILRNIIVERS